MAAEAAREGRRYRAFITYSHQDRRWAAWLHRRLEFYRVPRRLVGRRTTAGPVPRRLTPIFRDREELGTAEDLTDRIARALDRSDALIVVCSPAAAHSRWVNEEILRFKRGGRGNRIFCLVAGGAPFASDVPGREHEECFPPALRHRLDAAGELTGERAEPLAADVRAGGDGRSLALLKLVAGLLDLDLDELRRREQQRRTRRWAAVAALAITVMAATSLLALEATIQRHVAERRQKQAEALVAFMLGDFTDKLRKIGRLDILASLDEQAMKYFESLPPGDVDRQTLIQRAKALAEIGTTRKQQGDYGEAMEAFRSELAITSMLAKKYPHDAQRQYAWGDNLEWIGFIHYFQGDTRAAEATMAKAVTVLKTAVSLAPGNTAIQVDLGEALVNLGQMAERGGEIDKARSYYNQYMQISSGLVAVDPENAEWQQSLAYAWNYLGNIAIKEGRAVEGIRDFTRQNRILESLTKRDPSNQDLKSELVFNAGILGRMLYLFGQRRAGIHYLRRAVRVADGLVAYDSTQTDWREVRAYYSNVLANLLLAEGRRAAASALNATALSDLRVLTAKDSDNRQWNSDLSGAQLTAALIARAKGRSKKARGLASAAADRAAKALAADSETPDDAPTATRALLLLAQLAEEDENRTRAAAFRHKALAIIAPFEKPVADPRDLAADVSARLANGDTAGARPVVQRLWRMGYRTPSFVSELYKYGIHYPTNAEMSNRIAKLVSENDAASAATADTALPASVPSPASRPGTRR